MYDVLLIEDDPTYARLVEIALSGEVRVTVVRTLAEARERLPGLQVDAVLADLHLPDGQGAEVVEGLVAGYPSVAVIALSGLDGPTTDAALAAGAASFVLKGGELNGRMLAAIDAAARRTRLLDSVTGEDPPGAAVARADGRGAPGEDVTGWRTIAACAPVGLFRADATGACTWTNERFDQLTGLTAEQSRGEGWLHALHPGDRRRALEQWRSDIAREQEFSMRARFVRPDGSVMRALVIARRVADDEWAAGSEGGWIGGLEDETVRRDTERELVKSRAQLESILGASTSAISLKTPNDRYILANPACEALYARPTSEIIGASSVDLLGSEYGTLARELDRAVLETGTARQDELHIPHADGTQHCWLTVRFPVRDADGVLTGVGIVSTDITERRRLEREHALQRARLEEAQRIARLASWEWHPDSDAVVATTDFGHVLDVARDNRLRIDEFLGLIDEADRERVQARFELSQRVLGEYDERFGIVSRSGEARTLRVRWRSQLRDGRLVIHGSMQDITREHARERALAEAEEELRLTFDHAPIGLALCDLQLRWTRVNAAVCSLFGRRPGQLLGRSVDDVIVPAERGLDGEQFQRLLGGELEAFEVEKGCIGPDGSTIRIVFSVTRVGGGDGPGHVIVQLLDVTARRSLELRLQELADTDPLTGLANRRRLDAELGRMSARLRRSNEAATVLVIDLDGFKAVNDEHGHAVGDVLLRFVAQNIRRRLRQTDLVARLGGDEFAVLLSDATEAVADRVAAQILEAVQAAGADEGLPVRLGHTVSASIGIARLGSGPTAAGDALRRADAALYAAKRRGAGTVQVADPPVAEVS